VVFWKAVYLDGSVASNKAKNKYQELDRSKIVQFGLVDSSDRWLLKFSSGSLQNVFYRRRVEKTMGSPDKVVYLLGFLETVGDEVKVYVFALFEDLHVEWFDGFQEAHQWLYPIKFREDELR